MLTFVWNIDGSTKNFYQANEYSMNTIENMNGVTSNIMIRINKKVPNQGCEWTFGQIRVTADCQNLTLHISLFQSCLILTKVNILFSANSLRWGVIFDFGSNRVAI